MRGRRSGVAAAEDDQSDRHREGDCGKRAQYGDENCRDHQRPEGVRAAADRRPELRIILEGLLNAGRPPVHDHKDLACPQPRQRKLEIVGSDLFRLRMPTDVPGRRQVLAAVASSSHMTEFLATIGEPLDTTTRRRWRDRLKRWQIDTTHWTHSHKRWYSDEDLAQAVGGSTSCAEVLRRLGIPLAGGSQAYLARRIKASGLDTGHFLGQAHQRGRPARRRLSPEQLLRVLPPGSYRIEARRLRRALIQLGVPELCESCGGDRVWLGKPLRLIVDHRNGDWLDNRHENLRFLCPNCHAQTPTWCRRRQGGHSDPPTTRTLQESGS